MADLVSEIIAPEAFKQLDDAITKLGEATAAVKELAKAGKTVTFEFKGINNLQALNDLLNNAQRMTGQFAAASMTLTNATTQLNNATSQLSLSIKDNADRLAQQRLELGYVQEQLKIVNKDIVEGKGNIDQNNKLLADWTRRQQELKVEIGATTINIKAQIKETQATITSMEEMSQTLGILRSNYRQLSAEMRNSPIGQEMQTKIRLLDAELKELDYAIGNSQRNVGNYGSAWEKAGGVLNKIGNFIVRDLLRGIAGFFVFDLAFQGLTKIYEYITKTDDATMAAEKNAKKYTDALNRIDESAGSGSAQEKAQAGVLLSIAQNQAESMNIRLRAVKELQDTYPDYLGNIDKERILTGDLTTEMEHLNSALVARGLMEASTDRIGAAYGKIIDAEKAMGNLDTEQAKQFAEMRKAGVDVNKFGEETYKSFEAKRDVFRKQIKDAQKDITDLTEMAQKYAKEAGGLAVKKPAKVGNKSDETFKAESDYANSIYQLEKQRVESDRDNQKEISDNIKNDLQIRLTAYQQYIADLVILAGMERDKEIAIHAAKLAEIEEKEKTAKGKQLDALRIEADAQNNFIKAATEKFETEQNKILLNGKKATLDIIKSNNSEWVKSNEDAFAQTKLDEMVGYLTEENLLRDAFDKKIITRKQYDKDIKDLQQKQHIAFLQAEIEFDTRILANDKLSTEERIRFGNKLLSDQKALGAARAGVTADKPKLGNITDPIAKLFAPDGYDQLEQYQKEFYTRVVDLAKAASNAIIEQKNRQFATEKQLLDEQESNVRINAKQQEDVINVTAKTDIDRRNQLSKLAAQTAAQENAIEQEKRKVAVEQAKFQRTAAIAGIIESTAVAVAGALKYGPAAPPIIALILAAGAVQLATAAAAPIPQYRFGTGNHPGGSFIAGDGGQKELIAPPGKTPYWSNAISTLYNEAPGTKVIPLNKVRAFDVMGGYAPGGISGIEATTQRAENLQLLGKMFDASLKEHGENLSYIIMAARTKIPQPESMKDAVRGLSKSQGL